MFIVWSVTSPQLSVDQKGFKIDFFLDVDKLQTNNNNKK